MISKRKRRLLLLLLFSIAILLFINEFLLSNSFSIRTYYSNYYPQTIASRIFIHRSQQQLQYRITILSIVNRQSDLDQYQLAINSIRCYTDYHNYSHLIIVAEQNRTFDKLCPQQDFMFRRHCIAAEYVQQSDWTLFIDADIGVINPNHLIEQYIDQRVAIIFYNRIFNFEIMAGSYLANNSEYSKYLLRYWANYEFKLPNSFHGTDNGAIQIVLAELLVPDRARDRHRCELIWRTSKDYTDLYIFEACIRLIIGAVDAFYANRVKLLNKSTGWARDGWLTESMWSVNDFMLHGWQKKRLNTHRFASWPNPLVSDSFNQNICQNSADGGWLRKDSFMRTSDDIADRLQARIGQVQREYIDAQMKIKVYIDQIQRSSRSRRKSN